LSSNIWAHNRVNVVRSHTREARPKFRAARQPIRAARHHSSRKAKIRAERQKFEPKGRNSGRRARIRAGRRPSSRKATATALAGAITIELQELASSEIGTRFWILSGVEPGQGWCGCLSAQRLPFGSNPCRLARIYAFRLEFLPVGFIWHSYTCSWSSRKYQTN